jgi:hypothetical protein
MMTLKEQEKKVWSELELIKSDIENIIGFKINKRNYKKAIIELTRQAASEQDLIGNLPTETQEKIQNFFYSCQTFLSDVIWMGNEGRNLEVNISYKGNVLSHWKIPIDIFFSKEEAYAISSITMIKSFHDSLIGFLLSPKMRDDIVNGDQDAIKLLYSSMNRPSMPSSLSNLIMIKDNFPDFYKHITTKLDVMTVEEMKKYILNKSKE